MWSIDKAYRSIIKFLMTFLILLSLITSNCFAFDFTQDKLCFKNSDPEMADAAPAPWGSFAVKTGACQGIAGISAAFFEHAQFNQSLEKPKSKSEVREIISQILAKEKLIVPGYQNLVEFCTDYKSEFLRASVLYNRDIAISEIAQHYPQLNSSKGVMKTLADQKQVLNVLNGFEKKLQSNQLPLMLYFKHVVLVYDFKRNLDSIALTVYDSNLLEPREMKFTFDENQLPELSNRLIWDVTP